MTKVTIDRALIEQAVVALEITGNAGSVISWKHEIGLLRKALAEPAVEPSVDDSSVLSACQKLAQAFKESPPPPAEPARTSQDVCTVPLLSDEVERLRIACMHYDKALMDAFPNGGEGSTFERWNKARQEAGL